MATIHRDRREQVNQAAQAHRANLQANLQRRLAAAQDRGDERLIRLLEAEAAYLR